MDLLEAKLLSLYATDPAVRAKLDAAGSVTVATKTVPAKVTLAKVDARTIAKAKAHIHAVLEIPQPFVHEGHAITITALSLDGDLLRVDLIADCPTDGPYLFQNPPLQTVTKPAVFGAPGVNGLPTILTPRETADSPDAVLQTIVGQTVHAVAVQRGWMPAKDVRA